MKLSRLPFRHACTFALLASPSASSLPRFFWLRCLRASLLLRNAGNASRGARLFCLFLSTKGHAHKHTTKSKRIRTVTLGLAILRHAKALLLREGNGSAENRFFTTDCIKIEASWKWAHTKRPFAPILLGASCQHALGSSPEVSFNLCSLSIESVTCFTLI